MAVAREIDSQKLHRQIIVEKQRAFDAAEYQYQRQNLAVNDNERAAKNDEEEDGQAAEDKRRQQEEQEEEQDRTHFLLHALDVRRKHIAEAEAHVAEERKTKPTLWGYKFAFFWALLKDLLDLVGLSLPVISWIASVMFGFAIFLALYLAKTNRSLFEIRKIAVFIVGFIVEAVGFGINFLPIEVLTVLFIFLIDKAESNEKIAKGLQVVENIAGLVKK